MRIDVYDFDGTIYDGDSTVDFWLYCLRRKPALARFLPLQAFAGLMMATHAWNFTRGKGAFLRFISAIDAESFARDFWDEPATQEKIGAWFYERPHDLPFIIASASPQFMLAPIAKRLGAVHLVGTRADLTTGRLEGENCRAAEKISRLHALLGDFSVRAMYTDNPKADGPLLALADERYLITHGKLERMGKPEQNMYIGEGLLMTIQALTPQDALWEPLAAYAAQCSWSAGKSLASQMRSNAFDDWERVFAALEGDQIAGYCTLAKTDCIPDVSYAPYIGFVFVGEPFRGGRLSQRMIDFASQYARSLSFDRVYLVSDHVNLYEKYGFTKIDEKPAPWNPETLETIFMRRT